LCTNSALHVSLCVCVCVCVRRGACLCLCECTSVGGWASVLNSCCIFCTISPLLFFFSSACIVSLCSFILFLHLHCCYNCFVLIYCINFFPSGKSIERIDFRKRCWGRVVGHLIYILSAADTLLSWPPVFLFL